MKPVREQQAHKEVSKERSGSCRGKHGKDLIPVFVCCTRGKMCTSERLQWKTKRMIRSIEKNYLREKNERNGIIYLNCSKDVEGKM